MNYWVYILQNPLGRFYIGQTDDLNERVASHNRKDKFAGKYTRKNGPWSLVWSEAHGTRAAAMAREREIKSWKSARLIQIRLLGLKTQLSGRLPIKSGLTDWSYVRILPLEPRANAKRHLSKQTL